MEILPLVPERNASAGFAVVAAPSPARLVMRRAVRPGDA